MFSPQKDVLYEFLFDSGVVLVLRYDGRGDANERHVWYDTDTGTTLDQLPPYREVIYLGIPLEQE